MESLINFLLDRMYKISMIPDVKLDIKSENEWNKWIETLNKKYRTEDQFMDLGMVFLIGLMFLLLIAFIVLMCERDRINKRRYAELNVGDKFFLLDTYNGNKCIIEVTYINPFKGDEYVKVISKGNEYKYGMTEFFERVLIKNSRYYYEKINNDSFSNITEN